MFLFKKDQLLRFNRAEVVQPWITTMHINNHPNQAHMTYHKKARMKASIFNSSSCSLFFTLILSLNPTVSLLFSPLHAHSCLFQDNGKTNHNKLDSPGSRCGNVCVCVWRGCPNLTSLSPCLRFLHKLPLIQQAPFNWQWILLESECGPAWLDEVH